jgi:D-glycero-alpha-D-manno-heptose-7-phosphate kinase
MIISRTPLRMSFVGGGSDLPWFYRRFGGAVVSTAITKYVYVTVNPKFDQRTRVSYSRTEEVETVDEIRHPLVREAMRLLHLTGGMEITSIADVPSRGTGLGSSSAFAVGLLHVLHAFRGEYASADRLAVEACHVELERCGEPIGKQDQYAAAFGGINFMQFHRDDSVSVDPIVCRPETLQRLQENTLVLYTGLSRRAGAILKRQHAAVLADRAKQDMLKAMVQYAHDLRAELQNNHLDAVGEIIHANWLLKRRLSPDITTDPIDRWYRLARRHGALGGKLLGAGSGGFLMFYAPKPCHPAITRALKPLRVVDLGLEPLGSKIIFVHQ